MKRLILPFAFILIFFTLNAEEKVKTGKNLGVLPAISFNSDEGFQYGAILNLFNYGNGSRYPVYDYSAYLEVSRYTKGSSIYRFYFDTDKLINGVRSFFDLTYLQEDMLDFYGFNGYQSVYSTDFTTGNRTFYKMSQSQLRFMADFKGQFLTDNLFWEASYNIVNYKTGTVNYDKLNDGMDSSDPEYLDQPSLYEKYVDLGLISSEEADGGLLSVVKTGLVYDTRNVPNNPDKGICTEALIEMAPGFMNKLPYTRYSLVHRQYQSIVRNKLNAAVRLGIQGKIGDNSVPFFRRAQLISPFAPRTNVTGLGGASSLRGILKNRVVGDGFAFGNFELRWKAINFRFINQNFYLGVNGFVDTGIVTDPIEWDLSNVSAADMQSFDTEKKESFHTSVGGGLKIAMNENFIISVEMGKALDERDASGIGSYINLNYLF